MEYEKVEVNSGRWLDLENLKGEVWKTIKGFEDRFEISNYGRVKSLEVRLNCKIRFSDSRIKKAIIKKLTYDKDGYCRVSLWKDNRVKYIGVHRLVAMAFIPNPENKPQVNHINGIKDDNRDKNLEWNTSKENTQHAIKNRLKKKIVMPPQNVFYGKDNNKSQPVIMLDLLGNEIAKFECMADAKRFLKLDNPYGTGHIRECCRNERKTAYGYKWRFLNDNS